MQTVVNGLLVNYQTFGKGKKHLLILHGWHNDLSNWTNVATQLANRYQVILVDLPGHGSTEIPPSSWGIFDYADFAQSLLAKLKVKKVTIIGHSFGGRIAIILAARTKLVEGLILVDAAGVELKSIKVRLIRGLTIFFRPFLKLLPMSLRHLYCRLFGSPDYQAAGPLREIFKNVVGHSLVGLLPKIHQPTLIIWGEKDEILSLKEAKILKNSISKSILRIVWGAGHHPHVEKPVDFLNILHEEII